MSDSTSISRLQLSKFVSDPDALKKFEKIFTTVFELTPAKIASLRGILEEVSIETGSDTATLASIEGMIAKDIESAILSNSTANSDIEYRISQLGNSIYVSQHDAMADQLSIPVQSTLSDMADVSQVSVVAGSVLIWNTTARHWQNGIITGTGVTVTNGDGTIALSVTGSPPTGAAGGVLAGTYPNPSFASTTGSGAVVLATGATLVAPLLGTPASGVATNLTGTASGLTAGNVTTNANLTGPITSSGNATSIASQTGTGTKFVVDTSPTLITPVIGTATGTQLSVTNNQNAETDGISITNTTAGTLARTMLKTNSDANISGLFGSFSASNTENTSWPARSGIVDSGAGSLGLILMAQASASSNITMYAGGSGSSNLKMTVSSTGVAVTSLSATSTIKINDNTAALRTPPTGTLLQVSNADGVTTAMTLDGFATGPQYIGRRAQGTQATPTAVTTGNNLVSIQAYGYGTTAYSSGARGQITMGPTETWSDTAHGTKISFSVTGNTTATLVEKGTLDHDGTFSSIHLKGLSSTPTIAAGTGAGTGPTVSVTGTDTAMQVNVTTGTTPTGTNATVATITFNVAFAATPHPVAYPANPATAALSGATSVSMDGTATTTFTIVSGATALAASTAYKWSIHTIG